MANTFKNAGIEIGVVGSPLYTCPPGAQAVIHALYISNITETNATVDIKVTVDGGTTYRHVGKSIPIPPQSTLTLEKPINLESDDVISLTASHASTLEVVASILEVN